MTFNRVLSYAIVGRAIPGSVIFLECLISAHGINICGAVSTQLTRRVFAVTDCSWELVAYMKSLSADNASKSQFWIPADPNDRSNQSFTITTIKSMRSSYLDMQLYVERPGVEPQKESKTEP